MTGKRNLLFAEMMHIQKTEKDERKRGKMLKATQIFLYCKLDLALVCLVLCTKDILERKDIPYFQRLHVTRFDVAYEFAKLILNNDIDITRNMDMEYSFLGVFNALQTQVDLVCDYCGREIVNLCFTNANDFDGAADKVKNISILCPNHRNNLRSYFYAMLHLEDMKKCLQDAEKAVEKWKVENNK